MENEIKPTDGSKTPRFKYTHLKRSYRLTNIARAFRKLYFIIIIQLLGFAAFFLVPQGQDMMYVALANKSFVHGLFANAFIFYWALQCYLGARIILSFNDFTISNKQLEEILEKEEPNLSGQEGILWMEEYKKQYIRQFIAIQTQMPKYFYAAPYLIVIFSFIKASLYYSGAFDIKQFFVIAMVGFLGIGMYLLFLRSSKKFNKVYEKIETNNPGVKNKVEKYYVREVKVHKLKDFSELKVRERFIYRVSLLIFALSLIAFSLFPVPVLQYLGAISIISFGFASWIVVSYFMSYYDIKYLWPLKLSAFFLAVVFSYMDNDHPVNSIEHKPFINNRIEVKNYFDKWLEGKGSINANGTITMGKDTFSSTKKFPVVMIAAEGGASRSGYWTAKVLALLHDTLKQTNIDFNNHIFSYSSVSGGSLGTGVYYALTQQDSIKDKFYKTYVDNFFKQDMLAPIAGRLFFPEIAHVFSPYIFRSLDRVTVLEDTWNRAFNKITNNDYFHSGFLANTFDPQCKKPVWCINSTWSEFGNRAIVSNVKIDTLSFIHASDVFDSTNFDLPFATAISVSARFPFISPAGNILRNNKSIGHLVDGGYYENKGALTTYDLVRTINNNSKHRNKISIIIILITNDGEYSQLKPITALNEIAEPINSLYNVRSGHTQYAEDILLSLNTDSVAYQQYLFNDTSCKPISTRSYKIDLGLDGKTVPLNWNISQLAEQKINNYLDTCKKNKTHITGLLKQLKRK